LSALWGFFGAEPLSEWPQSPATVIVWQYVMIIRADPPCSEVCHSQRAVVADLCLGESWFVPFTLVKLPSVSCWERSG